MSKFREPLDEADVRELQRVFPELDWMRPQDWQSVASFASWGPWISKFVLDELTSHEGPALRRMLKLRKNRVEVRRDCRTYFGEENVPNINDPDQSTWA